MKMSKRIERIEKEIGGRDLPMPLIGLDATFLLLIKDNLTEEEKNGLKHVINTTF